MSVWLEQARAYPNGVVATPHYLATGAGLSMLASGGNAVDAAVAANLVLAVVAPYMCGVGGDLLATVWDGDVQAYRGVGRSPSGATLDAVREQSGSETMPTFGPHACTVPGAVDGWFTLLERWGSRSFGEVSATARRYAGDGFPLTRRGAWFFARNAMAFEHFGLYDFTNVYGVAGGGLVDASTRVGSHVATPRRRRPRRVLPRPDRCGDRRTVTTRGWVPLCRRHRRARGRLGRAVAGVRARDRDPGVAAPHAGLHGIGGLADRRRSRRRFRRPRPRAFAHRGNEDRARRSRRVPR